MSSFYCTQCGKKGIPVFRPGNKQREKGHLKKLYCCVCKKETNHAEVSGYAYTYEDFMNEFKFGHFTKEGKRIKFTDLKICKNTNCKYGCYYNGRCWNAQADYHCEERKV